MIFLEGRVPDELAFRSGLGPRSASSFQARLCLGGRIWREERGPLHWDEGLQDAFILESNSASSLDCLFPELGGGKQKL